MLPFSNDHDVLQSVPCGIDGSPHTAHRSNYLDAWEIVFPDQTDEKPHQQSETLLQKLIPCPNSRLCLIRLASGEITYSQLGDLLGIHRANAKKKVDRYLQHIKTTAKALDSGQTTALSIPTRPAPKRSTHAEVPSNVAS